MRLISIAVPYSENLGDGVIHECQSWAIGRLAPSVRSTALDLGGRDGYGHRAVPFRETVIAVLDALPPALRWRVASAALDRFVARHAERWRSLLAAADAAIIGGGNLFVDSQDLNFPKKVGAVAEFLKEARIPVAVHAVGVGLSWSDPALRLFRRLKETDLRAVSCRDRSSAEAWQGAMGGGEAQLAPDPGLLAAGVFGHPVGRPPQRALGGARIGVGVAAQGVLRRHADTQIAGGGDVAGFLLALIREIVARGGIVSLFTNGAQEDEALRMIVLSRARAAGLAVDAPARPQVPADLVGVIAACDGLIAHRLHASIVAYGLGVPSVGLDWDSKIGRFYAEVGRGELATTSSDPTVACDALVRAMSDPPSRDEIERITAQVHASLATTLARLGVTVVSA